MAGPTTPASGALVRLWLPPLLLLFLYGCCRCGAVEMERTLAMIKPDGLSGKYTEKIKAAILDSGFHIVKETEVQLDAERASLFYAEHSQRSFFDSLIKYITSGPVLAMVLERPDAIAQWQAMIGPMQERPKPLIQTALEQCVDWNWTQRKIVCMVRVHRNLQPERSHFSLEKLIL